MFGLLFGVGGFEGSGEDLEVGFFWFFLFGVSVFFCIFFVMGSLLKYWVLSKVVFW